MVTRVYGNVEGRSVIFTHSTDGNWNCVIPKTLNGEYVVELFAEDEAGNISYFATALFEVNAKHVLTAFHLIRHHLSMNMTDVRMGSRMTQYELRTREYESG